MAVGGEAIVATIPSAVLGRRPYDLTFTDRRIVAAATTGVERYLASVAIIVLVIVVVRVLLLATGGASRGFPNFFVGLLMAFVLGGIATAISRRAHRSRHRDLTLDQVVASGIRNMSIPYDGIGQATLETDRIMVRLQLVVPSAEGDREFTIRWSRRRHRGPTEAIKQTLEQRLGPRLVFHPFMSLA